MSLDGHLDVQVDPDRVAFVFTVSNDGTDPVILRFDDGQEADVIVRSAGQEIYRWGTERMFMQVVHQVELPPGETEIYELDWDEPVSGEFTAEAMLTATNQDVAARVVFSVP